MDADLVRAAHADAWEAHGRFRQPSGGGAARVTGARVMSSALPHPQWNSADIVDAAVADVDAIRNWYGDRPLPSGDPTPWGMRVPAGWPWPHGRYVLSKRLMGLDPTAFRPALLPAGVTLRAASEADVEAALAVDVVAFGEAEAAHRPWLAPLLSQPAVDYVVAETHGSMVAGGYCVRSDGDAGPAAYVAGIGVLPIARRRGTAAALSSYLVARAVAGGARLVHLQPDTEDAARIYARLGFVEVAGLDIYLDGPAPGAP